MKTTANKPKAADVLREFFSANAGRFFSVAQTAELAGVSASRIRELLPSLEEFGVRSEQGDNSKTYGMQAPATSEDQESDDPSSCPFCSSINFAPAGKAGTFLGDAGLVCNDCLKSWNKLTGQELPTAEKKRKAPMNPQYKINAKVDAVHKAGYSLSYEKATRRWTLTTVNGGSIEMTAQEFSLHTPESLVDMSSKLSMSA